MKEANIITIKNLKYSKLASVDTICFQCSVYINGNKGGKATNNGHGEQTEVELDPSFGIDHKTRFQEPCECTRTGVDFCLNGKCFVCEGTGMKTMDIGELVYQIAESKVDEKLALAMEKYYAKGREELRLKGATHAIYYENFLIAQMVGIDIERSSIEAMTASLENKGFKVTKVEKL